MQDATHEDRRLVILWGNLRGNLLLLKTDPAVHCFR